MKTNTQSFSRYMVSSSAGAGFQVWDRHEARIVARRKTFSAAQREAKRRNKAETS